MGGRLKLRKKNMQKTTKLTIAFIAVVALAIAGFDVYMAANSTEGDTISEVLLSFALRRPLVPFHHVDTLHHNTIVLAVNPQHLADAPPVRAGDHADDIPLFQVRLVLFHG